jgi:hypothetical protein
MTTLPTHRLAICFGVATALWMLGLVSDSLLVRQR